MITKKRHTLGRQLLLTLLAVLLAVSVSVPAMSVSAAPMPATGDLIIHDYALEDMAAIEQPENGNPTTNIPAGAKALAGVEFTVWQIDPAAVTSITTAADAWPHIMTPTKQTGVTDANGEVRFSSLPQGTYYVAETGNTGDQKVVFCEPFLVSVPMADPVTGNWNDQVHAYPKNQSIAIDKFVGVTGTTDYYKVGMDLPVETGERFDWYIRSTIPQNIGTANTESLKITDVLSGYFDYLAGSVNVYIMPGPRSDLSACTILSASDYTVSFNAATNTLTAELTASGIATVKSLVAGGNRYSVLAYSCQVNGTAPHGVALYSGATLEYTRNAPAASGVSDNGTQAPAVTLLGTSNNSGLTATPLATGDGTSSTATATVAMEPEVHTGKIGITKLADGTKKLLPGAQFGIAASEADAKAGNFIATGTTDANGRLVFSGLKYGVLGDKPDENSNNTTFWLKETKAPDGYKIMDEPVEITFNYQQDSTGRYYFAQLSVYNVKTGGSGTTGTQPQTGDTSNIYPYIGMAVLSFAALILLLVARKKRNPQRTM